jgi:hypothetical protein
MKVSRRMTTSSAAVCLEVTSDIDPLPPARYNPNSPPSQVSILMLLVAYLVYHSRKVSAIIDHTLSRKDLLPKFFPG